MVDGAGGSVDAISNLLGGAPYHVGIVVEDVGAAMEIYGPLFGVEWATRNKAEFPVKLGNETRILKFDSVYAKTGPVRVELTAPKPDTIWQPGGGLHHIGFFSDDPTGEAEKLAAAGYPVEALLFPIPGQDVAAVSFCRGPQNIFIELVSSALRPGMEAQWQ